MGLEGAKSRAQAAAADANAHATWIDGLRSKAQAEATVLCREFADQAAVAGVPPRPIFTTHAETTGWRGRKARDVKRLEAEGWLCPSSRTFSLPGYGHIKVDLAVTVDGRPVATAGEETWRHPSEIITWESGGYRGQDWLEGRGYRGSLQVVRWDGPDHPWCDEAGRPQLRGEHIAVTTYLLEDVLGWWLVKLGG